MRIQRSRKTASSGGDDPFTEREFGFAPRAGECFVFLDFACAHTVHPDCIADALDPPRIVDDCERCRVADLDVWTRAEIQKVEVGHRLDGATHEAGTQQSLDFARFVGVLRDGRLGGRPVGDMSGEIPANDAGLAALVMAEK
jgi:hypothetical protein